MSPSTLAHTTLPLTHLGCGGSDVLTAERELRRVDGVARVYVNPLTEMAYVEHDAALCSHAQLTAALRRAGHGGNTP